jgi:CBS domain-containing protein
MANTIRDVMSTDPAVCPATASIEQAAQLMRDRDIGDVLVTDNDRLCGLVTDRDIVVRAVAAGATSARLSDICSSEVVTVAPDDPIAKAVKIMRDRAIRRLPVVENGSPVGFVSIGDLAIESDGESALADISAASPNN